MAGKDHGVEFSWASEQHLRLCFGEAESADTHARVHRALAAIRQAKLPGVLDITPAYSTILLEFTAASLDEQKATNAVRRALSNAVETPDQAPPPVIEIPVCYEPPCAPDADDVARFHGIDGATLIRLHAQPVYTVQFIGFSPGFAYLSGLPKQLATPRLAAPRVRVPAGSVGIAGDQTGIYPSATAGGWRLIGRTPLALFDAAREKPSLLAAGDRVRFVPIPIAEFNAQLRGASDHA